MTSPEESPERRAEESRPFGRAAWLCIAVVAAFHFVSITRGSGSLFEFELLGAAYDSLAESLVQGRSTVAPGAILWEAFEIDGRTHMYFGPFPALLRIVPGRILPALFGRWSMASCLLASLLSLWAFARIARRALEGNPTLSRAAKRALLCASLLGFGLGTPLAFLMSSGSLYHESIAWGWCGSAWAIEAAMRLLDDRRAPSGALLALSAATGVALLSRVTFGLPLLFVTGLLTGACALESGDGAKRRARAMLGVAAAGLGPLALMLGVQLWYNADRFGSVATFIDVRHLRYLAGDVDAWGTLQRTGSFNPARLPSALLGYFGISPGAFSSAFPFVRMTSPEYLAPELYPATFGPIGRVVSLSVVSPWLLAGALAGVVVFCEARSGWLTRLCALALLGQLLLVMSYYIIEQRYAVDFLPFLVFAHAGFLRGAGGGVLAARGWMARVAPAMLWLLALLSLVATSFATLSWIPESGPFQRRIVKERVIALERALGGAGSPLADRPWGGVAR